jgi:hypothetical protein
MVMPSVSGCGLNIYFTNSAFQLLDTESNAPANNFRPRHSQFPRDLGDPVELFPRKPRRLNDVEA